MPMNWVLKVSFVHTTPASFKSCSFTVVAGTFANHDFATRRHELLTKMGYANTAIVKQARSGLYAIYVNTFDTKTDAFGLVKKLAGQQLNAYVLKQ